MIYTVTLNPALDIIYTTNELNMDTYTFSDTTYKFPGGKALNVTRMLAKLDVPSIATGFLGGFTGDFVQKFLTDVEIDNEFLKIEDDTRINVRLRANDKNITIAGVSPSVPESAIQDLLFLLAQIREGDILVMGGSIPNDVDPEIYSRIAEICQANRAEFVVDVPPKQMVDLLKYRPLLIKPNIENLAHMFGLDKITNELDIIKYGNKCIGLGAKNVIVSVGEEGSYLFTEKGDAFRSYGVKGKEVNSFNSRDAMIGGFLAVYMKTQDAEESFKMASACASATAFVEDLADMELTKEIYEKTVVEELRLS